MVCIIYAKQAKFSGVIFLRKIVLKFQEMLIFLLNSRFGKIRSNYEKIGCTYLPWWRHAGLGTCLLDEGFEN